MSTKPEPWELAAEFKKIRKAGVLWYVEPTSPSSSQPVLDVSATVVYRGFGTPYFIAFPSHDAWFMDKAYENRASVQDLLTILGRSRLFEGELISNNGVAQVRHEYDVTEFLQYLEKSHLSEPTKPDGKYPLYIKPQLISKLDESAGLFTMTYVCQECLMPEDECYFVWLRRTNHVVKVPIWIHNDGNMWTAHFNQYRIASEP